MKAFYYSYLPLFYAYIHIITCNGVYLLVAIPEFSFLSPLLPSTFTAATLAHSTTIPPDWCP